MKCSVLVNVCTASQNICPYILMSWKVLKFGTLYYLKWNLTFLSDFNKKTLCASHNHLVCSIYTRLEVFALWSYFRVNIRCCLWNKKVKIKTLKGIHFIIKIPFFLFVASIPTSALSLSIILPDNIFLLMRILQKIYIYR